MVANNILLLLSIPEFPLSANGALATASTKCFLKYPQLFFYYFGWVLAEKMAKNYRVIVSTDTKTFADMSH